MSNLHHDQLAEKYVVDDLPGAAVAGARLNGILLKIDAGDVLSALSRAFLAERGLLALHALTAGKFDVDAFRIQAALERADRVQRDKDRWIQRTAQEALQAEGSAAAIKAHFAAMANDPVLRRKREAKELKGRFAVGFVEPEHLRRVMSLLKQVAGRERLRPEDVAWISTEASYCWTDVLQRAWHELEAEAMSKVWENSGDPWSAVNASGHWRKAGKPDRALAITEAALQKVGPDPKPRSALLTTRGGAKRDVGRLSDAKDHGIEAHKLASNDFRPCTLLGAVHIELGELGAGHAWYEKAEVRGAKRQAIDQELRVLMARSDPAERQRIRQFLVAQDPARFGWLTS